MRVTSTPAPTQGANARRYAGKVDWTCRDPGGVRRRGLPRPKLRLETAVVYLPRLRRRVRSRGGPSPADSTARPPVQHRLGPGPRHALPVLQGPLPDRIPLPRQQAVRRVDPVPGAQPTPSPFRSTPASPPCPSVNCKPSRSTVTSRPRSQWPASSGGRSTRTSSRKFGPVNFPVINKACFTAKNIHP